MSGKARPTALAVMAVTALLLAGCEPDTGTDVGDVPPEPTVTVTPEPTVTVAPEPTPGPDPEDVPPPTEAELQAMRALLHTSTAILDEFWSSRFAAIYNAQYRPPTTVLTSLDGLTCGGEPLQDFNTYFCSSGPGAPYVAWDEQFMHAHSRAAASGAPAWVLTAHEYGHHVQWLLNADYSGGDEDAKELGADCLAGAVSKQIAEQGHFTADNIRGSLWALNNLADGNEDGTHGSSEERRAAFEEGFTGGPTACIAPAG